MCRIFDTSIRGKNAAPDVCRTSFPSLQTEKTCVLTRILKGEVRFKGLQLCQGKYSGERNYTK